MSETPLLEDETKKIAESRNILTKLFRLILAEIKITGLIWNKLMHRYLDDPLNRIPRDSRARSWTRGNLNKALLYRDAMTWNNFEQGLRFLDPAKAEFTMRLTWRDGKVTEHTLRIKTDRPQPQPFNDPDDL